jgi:hypothetical protein
VRLCRLAGFDTEDSLQCSVDECEIAGGVQIKNIGYNQRTYTRSARSGTWYNNYDRERQVGYPPQLCSGICVKTRFPLADVFSF